MNGCLGTEDEPKSDLFYVDADADYFCKWLEGMEPKFQKSDFQVRRRSETRSWSEVYMSSKH